MIIVKRALGWALILSPFVALAAIIIFEHGWLAMVAVFATMFGVVSVLAIGVRLIED